MMPSLICEIHPPSIRYEIEFSRNLLEDFSSLGEFVSKQGSKVAIISNSLVGPLYGSSLCLSLNDFGIESHLFVFEDGEAYKSRSTKESIENQMFEKKFGRDTCLIALGGGVVMDMGGFIAATYCRGISLVMIPTSLLGMVDACIGGKTGVNLSYGKNLSGSIYQPKKVFIDPFMLKTLSKPELKNGMAEMVKHALILDSQFFDYLDQNAQALLDLDIEKIEKAIYMSCQIKKRVVELDEKETGMRRLLNFGHTVAHALEKLNHYHLSHGEAVAIGLATESYLACLEGYLDPWLLNSILKLLQKFRFSFSFSERFPLELFKEAMSLDKKARCNQARFVMIDKIGSSLKFDGEYCASVHSDHINQALKWMYHDLCCYTGPNL